MNQLGGIVFIAVYNVFLGGVCFAVAGVNGVLLGMNTMLIACIIGLVIK